MITLQNLSTGYGSHVVMQGINAELRQGELVSLLGPNGVGKSTLLRTLSAFQPALAGDIRIDGRPLSQLSIRERSRLIGVVLTERTTVQHMTVRSMVGMGRTPYTGFWGGLDEEDRRVVDDAMQKTGIAHLQHRHINTLSDGERQKVMIAKAVAQETPIILLDEPTAFLDYPSKVDMMRMLLSLAHGMQKVIFLSTHDVEMALQLSDRVWLMEDGHLTTGTPRQLAQDGSITRFVCREGVSFDTQSLTIQLRVNA